MPNVPNQFPRRTFLVAALGFGGLGALAAVSLPNIRPLAQDAATPLPAWASASPRTARAYHAALRRSELLGNLPCYCGCMTSMTTRHSSLRDCFLHADGTLETHAAGCETCIDQSLDADAWASSNLSVATIQQRTNDKYDQIGCTTQRCVE
jgi:hypothetical protein